MRPPDAALFFPNRDVTAALELRGAVWGADHPHTNANFLNWLFSDSGNSVPQGVLERGAGGQPVGFAGLCVKRLMIDNHEYLLAHGLDYMIRPGLSDLITGRLAVKVARNWIELARALDCSYGLVFPNDNSNRILTSRHIGLASVFSPTLMLRPLWRASPQQRLHPMLPQAIGAMILRAASLASAAALALRASDGEPDEAERFNAEYDDLWHRAAVQFRVATVRDARYLAWRYAHHPIYDYQRLAWRRNGRVEGFAAVSARTLMGVRAMLLIELLAAPLHGPAATGLIEEVVREAGRGNYDAVAALAIPGSALFRALVCNGFYPTPRALVPKLFNTAGIAFEPQAAAAADGANWHFTWGDTDVV